MIKDSFQRRLLGLCLFAFLLSSPAWAQGAGSGDAVPWTQWRGSDRDGISRESDWDSMGKKTPLWTQEVGLGYSSFSAWEDRVFTLGFEEKEDGKGEDVIVALDAETGERLWEFRYPAELRPNMHKGGSLTTPVIEEGIVYLLSREGPLFCLDGDSGEILWQRQIDKEFEVSIGFFGLCASPLILEEALILNVGKTIALNKETGATLWETDDYGYSYSTPTDFSFRDKEALAVFNAKGLVLMSRENGEEWFLHPWTSKYNVNCATPITLDSRVFISTGYDDVGCAMFDFAQEEPKLLWENKKMRNKMAGSVLYQDHLFGFDDKMFVCLNLDGEEVWRQRGMGLGSFILSDGRFIIVNGSGELVIAEASPEGYEEITKIPVFDEGEFWTTPVLFGGRIYLRNSMGKVVCRDHR